MSTLPNPKPSQPYVHVSVLEGGRLYLAESFVIDGGSSTKVNVVPSMAFVLRHSESGKRIVFDIGLRKDWENYPPKIVQTIKTAFQVNVPVDVVDSLRRGGVEPHEVDTIVLSHMHFDHIGDPTLFPSAHFVVHDDSKQMLASEYAPEGTKPPPHPGYTQNLLPDSRTEYLSSNTWGPIGPFPRAHDLLGDGSIYIVDAPGHTPGHINALVRTSADGAWLHLAADSAHDMRLITGEKEMGMFPDPNGDMTCIHMDMEAAKEHIERVKKVKAIPRVDVVLSHDWVWFEENRAKGVFFPGEIRPL